MPAIIVWLDSKEAHLYHLRPEGMQKEHLKKHVHEHSNSHADARGEQEDHHYYHEIIKHLSDASQLLLMGPGLAKTHFKAHLEKHHHAALAQKVVGVETVDHPTEKQVIATAKKFFKEYDLFH